MDEREKYQERVKNQKYLNQLLSVSCLKRYHFHDYDDYHEIELLAGLETKNHIALLANTYEFFQSERLDRGNRILLTGKRNADFEPVIDFFRSSDKITLIKLFEGPENLCLSYELNKKIITSNYQIERKSIATGLKQISSRPKNK